MLEAVKSELSLLEVLDVPEVMRCLLLRTLRGQTPREPTKFSEGNPVFTEGSDASKWGVRALNLARFATCGPYSGYEAASVGSVCWRCRGVGGILRYWGWRRRCVVCYSVCWRLWKFSRYSPAPSARLYQFRAKPKIIRHFFASGIGIYVMPQCCCPQCPNVLHVDEQIQLHE